MNKISSLVALSFMILISTSSAKAEELKQKKRNTQVITTTTPESEKDFVYLQAGGGLGILIEYDPLKRAPGFDSRFGFKTRSGWGAEIFFDLLFSASDAPVETRKITADSKILGVAPTYTIQLSNDFALGLGLGVGYLVVNRSYFGPTSYFEGINRWSLAPSIDLVYGLGSRFYADLAFRAVFTLTDHKLPDEPRILLPTLGFGYRF